MSKIPCFILIYYDFDIIKNSLDFLAKHGHELDLIVIENNSKYTKKKIKPYVSNMVKTGKISKYFLTFSTFCVNICQ